METKWQIGPVKLASGEEAFIDAINEGQDHYRYTGRMPLQGALIAVGWNHTGRLMYAGSDNPGNLAPPPKRTVRVKRWFNVYLEGEEVLCGAPHKRRKDCDTSAKTLFACIQIDREVTEGEGV
jgi:hypothetical protein